ncbi:MAG: hypothetical protein ACLFVL_06560, partial [Candidatus Aenigmatarchaeota archaeon]
EEIDDSVPVKIYNKSFHQDYQQGYKERGVISKRKFRFRDNLLARLYHKIRFIREIGANQPPEIQIGGDNSAGRNC